MLQRYQERGADGLMNQRHRRDKDRRIGPKTPEVGRSTSYKILKSLFEPLEVWFNSFDSSMHEIMRR